MLSVECVGFLRQMFGASSMGYANTPLTISPGLRLISLEFELVPQAVITGKVVDNEGEAVARASLSVFGLGKYGGLSRSAGVGGTSANELGEFRIAELAPGRYILQATPAMMTQGPYPTARDSNTPEQALRSTYYPSAADPGSAVPIEVRAGQTLSGMTIALRKGPVYRIQGRVVGRSPNVSLANINLQLAPREGASPVGMSAAMRSNAMAKADGSFEFINVAPGPYCIAAMRTTSRSWGAVGFINVDVTGSDLKDVLLPVSDPMWLFGTIRAEGQEKVLMPNASVVLRPVDNIPSNNLNAVVDSDQSFRLDSVAPIKYYVTVMGLPGSAYVKSVRMGNQEVLDTGLDMTQVGTNGAMIEVVLGTKTATVEGVVREDGKPVSGKPVMLVPDPVPPSWRFAQRTITSNQNGQFVLPGVAPGAYRLYALEDSSSIQEFSANPETLKRFEHKSVKLTLREGVREQVDVSVLKPEDAQIK